MLHYLPFDEDGRGHGVELSQAWQFQRFVEKQKRVRLSIISFNYWQVGSIMIVRCFEHYFQNSKTNINLFAENLFLDRV